jgi:hypothetical protein
VLGPWPHHENTNPSGFTSDLTDREKPAMPYTKDGDRLNIKATDDATQVPADQGGAGPNPGSGVDTGAGNNPGSNRKNKFPVDRSTSTSDPNNAVTPAPTDAQISKMPSDWVQDKEFLSKCQSLASKYGCQLNEILGVMHFESAATMSPAIQNKFGYTGLIQLGNSACVTLTRAYGQTVTTDMLKRMSRVEYMDWVEKYYDYWIKALSVPQPMNLAKLYLIIAYPAASKYDSNYPFGPVGSAVWTNNPAWRSGGGGPVTPASIAAAPQRSVLAVDALLKKGGAQPLA